VGSYTNFVQDSEVNEPCPFFLRQGTSEICACESNGSTLTKRMLLFV
jgi:hypothetical protein